MTPREFLLVVFRLIDDEVNARNLPRLRARGPRPTLADREVITSEWVGAFWGRADDRAIRRHFRHSPQAEFPRLAAVDRSTFVRQAANLRGLNRRLHGRRARLLADPDAPWLIDSVPLPVGRCARARTCRRFAGPAAHGFDPVAPKACDGFRPHPRTSLDGVILGCERAAANAAETARAAESAPAPVGTGLGDRNLLEPGGARGGPGGRRRVAGPVPARQSGPRPEVVVVAAEPAGADRDDNWTTC